MIRKLRLCVAVKIAVMLVTGVCLVRVSAGSHYGAAVQPCTLSLLASDAAAAAAALRPLCAAWRLACSVVGPSSCRIHTTPRRAACALPTQPDDARATHTPLPHT